jgi:hypothetical protein
LQFTRYTPVLSNWNQSLVFPIAPKSGPMRRMVTLIDANRALLHDLPGGYLKWRGHWASAARALIKAVETGAHADNVAAYEELVAAIEREGWFARPARGAPRMPQAHAAVPMPPDQGGNVVRLIFPKPEADPTRAETRASRAHGAR